MDQRITRKKFDLEMLESYKALRSNSAALLSDFTDFVVLASFIMTAIRNSPGLFILYKYYNNLIKNLFLCSLAC